MTGMPACAAGDSVVAGSWDELVRDYRATVYRHALRLTRNHAEAEDLTQDTFVRALRAYDRYRAGATDAWLKRITTNLFLDSIRRRRRIAFEPLTSENAALAGPSAENVVLAGQLEPALADAIAALPAHMRTVVVMRYVDQRTDDEIAATLRVNVSTVRTRSHRARARLRRLLEGSPVPASSAPPRPASAGRGTAAMPGRRPGHVARASMGRSVAAAPVAMR